MLGGSGSGVMRRNTVVRSVGTVVSGSVAVTVGLFLLAGSPGKAVDGVPVTCPV